MDTTPPASWSFDALPGDDDGDDNSSNGYTSGQCANTHCQAFIFDVDLDGYICDTCGDTFCSNCTENLSWKSPYGRFWDTDISYCATCFPEAQSKAQKVTIAESKEKL